MKRIFLTVLLGEAIYLSLWFGYFLLNNISLNDDATTRDYIASGVALIIGCISMIYAQKYLKK